MPTLEEFWAELDALGEDEVRRRLVRSFYGGRENQDKRPAVEEWLRRKEAASANAAALEARDMARQANKIAIASIIIAAALSAIAILIAILGSRD